MVTGWVDQYQFLYALRLCQGEVPGDIAPQGIAGHHRFAHAQVIEQQAEDFHHPLGRIHAITGGAGEAKAGHIETDNAVVLGKGADPTVPGVQGGDHTVNQHQRRFVARAFVAVVHVKAVQLDKPRAAISIGVAGLKAFQWQRTKTQTGKTHRQRRR